MDKDTLNIIIIGIIVIMAVIGLLVQHSRLDDADNQTVIYTHQLTELLRLTAGVPCVLAIYRQSGNLYSDPLTFKDAASALAAAFKTMNRAKIDSLQILTNTESCLKVRRAFKNYQGKDGRKVGGFAITLMSE